jgi:HEAT repeat protein
MRRIATLGSSLLLLAAGFVQDGASDAELKKRLKDLAAGGAAATEALAALDPRPVSRLETIHHLALREPRDVRSICRAVLPPASWSLSDLKTIGDVRARLRQYASDLGTAEPEKQELRWEAIRQLTVRGNSSSADDLIKEYRKQPTNSGVGGVLAIIGTTDHTPALLEILDASGNGCYGVLQALAAVGDSRAEQALVKRMAVDPEKLLMGLDALSLLGGDAALEALRKSGADPKAPAWLWNKITDARMSLRDPRLPADLMAVSGPERHVMKHVYRGLVRMGDRSVLPDLVKRLEDPKASPEDRMAALQVIAVLGNREHAPLAIKCLEDRSLAGVAADALAEFGDALAAAPLARALKHDPIGNAYARALMYAPLQEVEADLLEILNDPMGHKLAFFYALAPAGRLGGNKVREKLIALLLDTSPRLYDGFEVARVLVPLLAKKDLRRLSRSSSPEAPHESDDVRYPRLAARGALGDEAARRDFVRGCLGGHVQLRMDERTNPLFKYPGPITELMDEIRKALESDPSSSNAVEYMVRLRPAESLVHVEKASGGKSPSSLVRGLAALMNGEKPDATMAHAIDSLEDGTLEAFARALPAETVRKLRKSVLEESLAWRSEGEVKDPKNPAAPPVKRTFYRMGLVGDLRLGILAARRDPVLESVYRSWVRSPLHQRAPFTDRMTALALADLGADDMYDTYARWLKADGHERRSLGAQCLARLGDRRAIQILLPLLDDHERTALTHLNPMPDSPIPPLLRRVCDDAADAIEKLSGEKFPSERGERLAAIKAWIEKSDKK